MACKLLTGTNSIALQRQLDYFRMWAVQYIVPFTNQSGFRVNLTTFSSVDGSSSAGVESTASSFALAATDKELLSSDIRGMVSGMLIVRGNMKGEIEKSLRNAIQLRETLKSELKNRK